MKIVYCITVVQRISIKVAYTVIEREKVKGGNKRVKDVCVCVCGAGGAKRNSSVILSLSGVT